MLPLTLHKVLRDVVYLRLGFRVQGSEFLGRTRCHYTEVAGVRPTVRPKGAPVSGKPVQTRAKLVNTHTTSSAGYSSIVLLDVLGLRTGALLRRGPPEHPVTRVQPPRLSFRRRNWRGRAREFSLTPPRDATPPEGCRSGRSPVPTTYCTPPVCHRRRRLGVRPRPTQTPRLDRPRSKMKEHRRASHWRSLPHLQQG